jgi:hypothetical protein
MNLPNQNPKHETSQIDAKPEKIHLTCWNIAVFDHLNLFRTSDFEFSGFSLL